jgi:ligand-binding sensor domain-containing protein
VGECPPEVIDRARGLLDDKVDDLAVDRRNRVWVLTEKGINIVEP